MYLRKLSFGLKRSISFVASNCMPYSQDPLEIARPRNPYYDPLYEESIWGPQPRCVIGGKHVVTVANGIGIGPELMDIVRHVFLCANAPIDFEVLDFGQDATSEDLENLIYSVKRNGVAIKGNFTSVLPEDEQVPFSYQMKRALDLCINVVEVKSHLALVEKTRFKHFVDVVVICPNSEGSSSFLEHDNGKGVENLRVTTQYTSQIVADFAFKYATKHNRRNVTLVYNKGIMNFAEGTIISAVSDVASRHPEVSFNKQSMKAFIFKMSSFPFNGDVVVAMPSYAGLIKNILFGLIKGCGLYCVQNLGPRYAVFGLASRNKGSKMAGKDIANPLAALDGGVKLLNYLGHHESAEKIRRAIEQTVNEDHLHTRDISGEASTSAVVANIERRIREVMPEGYREEPPVLPPLPSKTT